MGKNKGPKKKNQVLDHALGQQLLNSMKAVTRVKVEGEGPREGYRIHELAQATYSEKNKRSLMSSVLEQNSLDEFVQIAQLSQQNFGGDRNQQRVQLEGPEVVQTYEAGNMAANFIGNRQDTQYQPLKIPRRPAWRKGETSAQMDAKENLAFLEWRRDVAQIEEGSVNLAITPFEKNVQVWKQLWRVIEKSDLLLQIVDARNPYFYYSSDLEKYINEVKNLATGRDKKFLLLINKADFLSPDLITHWNEYFLENKVNHIFFSALHEQSKLDSEVEETSIVQQIPEDPEEDAIVKTELQLMLEADEARDAEREGKQAKERARLQEAQRTSLNCNQKAVFTRDQLMAFLKNKSSQILGEEKGRIVVGTIGYPNVGKSSVINVLCGIKRVSVAAMPGKTKHFQTLNISDDIQLCDCPGLVFPSMLNSRAEMFCCGVLPIESANNLYGAIQLIMNRIPKEVLENHYKISLPKEGTKAYNVETFLETFAVKKGWLTGGGSPNQAQASKYILKEYVTGILPFCTIRPDYDPKIHKQVQQSGFKTNLEELRLYSLLEVEEEPQEEIEILEEQKIEEVDSDDFEQELLNHMQNIDKKDQNDSFEKDLLGQLQVDEPKQKFKDEDVSKIEMIYAKINEPEVKEKKLTRHQKVTQTFREERFQLGEMQKANNTYFEKKSQAVKMNKKQKKKNSKAKEDNDFF